MASTLLTALHRPGSPATGPLADHGRNAVFDTLAWCWRAITESALTALGHTHTPQARIEDWPRVWWCPTGPAAVLPLHAAGLHPRTTQHTATGEPAALADTVTGRVISSYTSTLASLIRARTRPAPGRVRQLVAGIPEAPGYIRGASPLPAVCAELAYVPILQSSGQVVAFMTQHLGMPIPSPALMEKISTKFRRSVESFASANGIPWVKFAADGHVLGRFVAGCQPAIPRSDRSCPGCLIPWRSCPGCLAAQFLLCRVDGVSGRFVRRARCGWRKRGGGSGTLGP